MSLLMQALRKAEEAKRAAAEASSTTATPPAVPDNAGLSLEPLTPRTPPAETASTPSLETPPRVEPAIAPATSSPPPPVERKAPPLATPSVPAAEQKAAQNVFAAKSAPRKNSFAIVVGSATLLAVAGIGGYFWWQLRPVPAMVMPPIAAPAPVAPTPPTTPVPASLPAAPTVAAPAEPIAPARPVTTVAPTPAAAPETTPLFNHSRSAATGPIRLRSSKPTLSPLATQAYDALQAGNLTQAQQLYQKLLATDPMQMDALYGLAAIAVQRNQIEQAEDYFLRILEIDPRDAFANAGIIGLHAKTPGENQESRLKSLLADRPSPVLQFALGNLYAKQERWREAQQAYFNAFQGDSSNPDFAFNLAVSLDQLRQAKVAAQYYGVALKLARQHSAAFNTILAQERMRELQAQ